MLDKHFGMTNIKNQLSKLSVS